MGVEASNATFAALDRPSDRSGGRRRLQPAAWTQTRRWKGVRVVALNAPVAALAEDPVWSEMGVQTTDGADPNE